MNKKIPITKYTHVITGCVFQGLDTGVSIDGGHLVLDDVYLQTRTAVKGGKVDRIDMVTVVHHEIGGPMNVSLMTMLIRRSIYGVN